MLAWTDDSLGYAGGSVATGRASQAGQAKGEDPDKEATQKRRSNGFNGGRGVADPTAAEADETPQDREGQIRLCSHGEGG